MMATKANSIADQRSVDPQIVRTLIGHRQVPVGLRCLRSLVRLSLEPLSLFIHDDGTLTAEDCDKLLATLPGARLVSRADADAEIWPRLEGYPRCSDYRRRHPLALKLIDMPLAAAAGDLAYCDSDILFVKPYTQLFRWPNASASAIFMQDRQDAYSLRPWHIHPVGKIRVPRNVNTGLIFFRAAAYDLDFVEWFLGRQQLEKVFQKRAHWIEQTCWAALGWRAGCYVWDARQFIIAAPQMPGLSAATVGIHFVASYRSKLDEFPDEPDQSATAATAIPVEAGPARRTGPRRMLVQHLVHRL